MLLVFSRIEKPLSKLLHKFVAKGFFFKSLEVDEFGLAEALPLYSLFVSLSVTSFCNCEEAL
jgi:hypothetical protein